MFILDKIGKRLAAYLAAPRDLESVRTSRPGALAACLQVGDVLLIEGTSRFSSAIKYLTQSSWSHAALYVGDALGKTNAQGEVLNLIEADIIVGVQAVPLSHYESWHTRICRPQGLTDTDCIQLIEHARSRLGHHYDLKNIFDLARYFIATPPVPGSWKRRMLAFGSGDPTRAICSSLIAEAFQSIHYPILPDIELQGKQTRKGRHYVDEIMHIRHHSLFVPRDFDVSPYFDIIKPTLVQGFDFHKLTWNKPNSG